MSSAKLFEGVRLKIERAQSHLNELHRELFAFRDRRPYEWDGPHVDGRLKRITYYVKVHEEPKIEWGLLIGDCVQNLRAALDHLVYALSANPDGSPPSNEDKCAFPICSHRAYFNTKTVQERLSSLDDQARSLVKFWQPMRRGVGFAHHPLWLLRELSDWDKHRLIHVAGSHTTSSDIRFSIPVKGARHWLSERPFEDGAPIAALDFSRANTEVLGAGPEIEVDVNATFGWGVCFVDGPAATDGVTYVIEDELLPHVRDRVVPSFQRLF